jgi:predicted Zn-dependent peptidase
MTIRTTTFDNGFRIVTEEMPGLKSASLGIWVGSGARHETLIQNGIAHFLEHMAFKGTDRRSALEIVEAIEDVGGYINAYTSREMTAYYVRVLEQDVPLGFDIISDIVLNSTFDDRELEIERGVILQEIGQSLDTPDDVVFDWLQDASYPDQPLGRTILGPAERVRSFTRDDLAAFVSEHYVPDQMVLSAAGAIDHDALVKAAEPLFGSLAKTPKRKTVLGTFKGGEIRKVKDLEQAHFTLALEGPSYLDDSFLAAQTFSIAFGGGMSSRLFQELRERRGLCYSIYASAGAFADTGTMTIYSGTSEADIADMTNVTIDELKRAADDMSQVELDRARTQLKAGMLMGLESASSRCERLARMMHIWDRVPSLDEVSEKMDAINVGDLRGIAERYCSAGKGAMALYGPVDTAPDLDALLAKLAA